MSNLPPTAPPSPNRWLLPVLALLTVLGIVAVGAWFSRQEPPPAAPSTRQGQPPLAAVEPQANVAQAPVAPSNAQDNKAVLQPLAAAPSPVVAAQTSGTATPKAVLPGSSSPAVAGVESLIDPLSAEQSLDPGEPARARVTVSGVQTPLLSPNQVGSFPRVYLPQGGKADVQVQLPDAQVGDQVVTAMEDGGTFANAKPVQALTVDENHQIAFQFQANQAQGTFRVSLRHNAETKIVTFWAGERIALPNY